MDESERMNWEEAAELNRRVMEDLVQQLQEAQTVAKIRAQELEALKKSYENRVHQCNEQKQVREEYAQRNRNLVQQLQEAKEALDREWSVRKALQEERNSYREMAEGSLKIIEDMKAVTPVGPKQLQKLNEELGLERQRRVKAEKELEGLRSQVIDELKTKLKEANSRISAMELITEGSYSHSLLRVKACHRADYAEVMDHLAHTIHQDMKQAGFWNNPRNDGEALMLVVTEIAEAVEGLRHGNPPSDHIPRFSLIEEELADAIIRILDLAAGREWRVPQALVAKVVYNRTRPRKHGKEF